MIELPESYSLARQLNATVQGKHIVSVAAGHTPHKLCWYYGDPPGYESLLVGQDVGEATALGSMVEIEAGDARILFGEGVNARYHPKGEPRPASHQLLLEFADGAALSAAIRMYGGLGAFRRGEMDSPYYSVAWEKPSPFSPDFDRAYFEGIVSTPEVQKLSLKALLATEQRIPGLGNGTLQDILFSARMHPKRKTGDLSAQEKDALYAALKSTLAAMAEGGGRDTELDLFGRPGGYHTILSKNSAGKPCPACGGIIRKEAYMGGSIYYCTNCQQA